MRTTPKFWWDYKSPAESPIVVQSDWELSDVPLAEFHFDGHGSQSAINAAELLISDFNSGRKTPTWTTKRDKI